MSALPRLVEGIQLADMNADGDAGIKWADRAGRVSEPRRVILFIGPSGVVSESLVFALEREFSWVEVEQVERVDDACASFSHSVSLIIVEAAQLKAAEAASTELSILHPHALAAVIEVNDRDPVCSVEEIFDSRFVRGVLPMNLRLDLWLSVIRLMLRGGEYFPADLIRSYAKRLNREATVPDRLDATDSRVATRTYVGELTARELQILEMVSRGLQNKTIATSFGLSEHTVKVHLHNIISKLGAHNRTEAAALFRDHKINGTRI
ncbi:response regulator transcription factor [Aminobacter sp. AP02]|uniref:helix-turn-helix transcriptional regulator n=1 Tax=Aminobacter sp. AP02 TaxID=2135737 RepID=UPI000D7A893F|nr:response regulator transcription factor [Aminobacter sp. AP02]PWK76887.1 DNA-binding NarL/FixJ family response regulator [Aminobacter sp. AP02]